LSQINTRKGAVIIAAVLFLLLIIPAALNNSPIQLAKAQSDLTGPDYNTTTNNPTNTTTSSTANANTTATSAVAASSQSNYTLSGIIASTQLNQAGAPQWLTAGSWTLVTDQPVFGSTNTNPTVKSFSAVLVMTASNNGTMTHSHHISNFKQIEVTHPGGNSTIFNGTMTVTTEMGTTENVPGILDFQNDRMSIWVSPGQIQNHFGPTPIDGIILNPQLLQMIRSEESSSIQPTTNTTAAMSGSSSSSAMANNTTK